MFCFIYFLLFFFFFNDTATTEIYTLSLHDALPICDHRCTFCIIPYGRGNSRSVPMGEVVAQVRRLVDNGYREAVLTGVDLTSYGGNLPGAPKLGHLVKQILKHVPD